MVYIYKHTFISINILVLACNRGQYGIDCSETCGKCLDVNQCFNVNGRCLTGCEDGYVGNLCKTRKYFYMNINI